MPSLMKHALIILVAFSILASCAMPQAKRPQTGTTNTQTNVAAPNPTTPENTKQERDLQHVKNVVKIRANQLQATYKKQSAVQPMQGTLLVKLYITEMGTVQNVDLTEDSGSLSKEFIETVRREALAWQFIIREKMIYSFKLQFTKM